MGKLKKIKYSKTAINTELSTRKSESSKEVKIYDEKLREISLNEIPKAALTYKGAYPYLMDALSELCTINPMITDKDGKKTKVIKGQDDNSATHFSACLKWESLTHLATRNEPTSKDRFLHEILALYKSSPSLYINLGNGVSVLTHPFIIRTITFDDLSVMRKADAEKCKRLGITKKISYIDIEFFKPLFYACFQGKEDGGFIYTDPAFFAMLNKTIAAMRKDEKILPIMTRFYNPKTKQWVTKYPSTYHKFILYLLTHISSNEKATTLTLKEPEIIEMLKHIDPRQLTESNGKTYIRNQFDTKLFFDKACMIYNQMARYGYCEHTIAVSEHCIYSNTADGLQIVITYRREKPRTCINAYTSNFQNEIMNNAPLQIGYTDKDDL